MKLLFAVVLSVIGGVAHAQEPLEIMPLQIFKPTGQGDGSKWKVSFTPSYLGEGQKDVTQPTVTFDIASGECATGVSSVVSMHGDFTAKVQQKICVGVKDGKTLIVGWLVAPGATPKPLMDESLTEYGTGINFVFDGNYLEAAQSVYKFKAEKQIGQDKTASL